MCVVGVTGVRKGAPQTDHAKLNVITAQIAYNVMFIIIIIVIIIIIIIYLFIYLFIYFLPNHIMSSWPGSKCFAARWRSVAQWLGTAGVRGYGHGYPLGTGHASSMVTRNLNFLSVHCFPVNSMRV